MKHDTIAHALDQISLRHIEKAANYKKKHTLPWIAAVAAVLAVAVTAVFLLNPLSASTPPALEGSAPGIQLQLLAAKPNYPRLSAYPIDYEETAYENWHNDLQALHDQPVGYADNLKGYFASVISRIFNGQSGENVACSPLNLYMALAMLAETTEGESRRQILELLHASDIETLRTQAKQVWEGHYNNDGLSTSILANSLWLKNDYPYNKETAQLLADEYYASVFHANLGSEEANQALRDWLNEQTGGLLKEQAAALKLDARTDMALASTIYYQVQWQNDFSEKKNTKATFHAPSGDREETFMNQELSYGPYYWSDRFSAVYLPLEDNGRMWLILPDEGVAPEEITDEVAAFLSDPDTRESKSIIVNLSVPKFDISSDLELSDTIRALGVTDIFQPGTADFSPIFPDDDGFIDLIKHTARVAIDEKGVTAAAYTVIGRCGAGMPLGEEIDFVLDRPFLFYVESQDGLPLFTGIVNEP